MKLLLSLVAPVALIGSAAAQQVQVPQSMDLTITPGAMPLSIPASGARATTACDDFNRTTGLGSDWVGAGGCPDIYSDMFGSCGGNSMAQHTVASVSYDAAVIRIDLPDNPQTLTYGAAVHGLGGGDNTFTKVQNNSFSPGPYNTMGFYHGFNGGGAGGYGGFFTITPVVGGWMDVYTTNAGDTMNIDIDENRDGVVDYNYTSSGILANVIGMGTAVGIGAYGSAFGSADDWELNGGCVPAGPTLAIGGSCPGPGTIDCSNMTAGGTVYVGYTAAGAGSTVIPGGSCAGSTVNTAALPTLLFIVTADGAGNVSIPGVMPSSACGVITVVAFDVASCTSTNTVLL